MNDLAEWLLGQIAEDERVARDASDGAPTWSVGIEESGDGENGYYAIFAGKDDFIELDGAPVAGSRSTHIARWDPARVLAECEAKRRIVEWHKSWPVLVETPPTLSPEPGNDLASTTFRMSQQIAWLTEQEYRNRFGTEPPTSPILRLLALPYADRPGYLEEWAA